MAYLTEAEVQKRAAQVTRKSKKSESVALESHNAKLKIFDIFLSHSSAEPEEILLGVTTMLEDKGLRVYVDRYTDPHLSPNTVTPYIAQILRSRMQNSGALLYIHSRHSFTSRWMPWELGFFDGSKGRVAVLPITENQADEFRNQEYLNLYPYVDIFGSILWVNNLDGTVERLEEWLKEKC